jgi:hypothetical protein
MAVFFYNDGELELDTIRVMGLSVKVNDNPIGYFGTGLKYAIATLIRTGHKVILTTNGKEYVFSKESKTVRGKDFEMIMMNDEQLPFTTQLGKNWEIWQAYRELHSNCNDEGGKITNQRDEKNWDTCLSVIGEGIDNSFHERTSIFIYGDPFIATKEVEVFKGKSQWIYYRGVRVHKLRTPSIYTYNLLKEQELTEDRTLKSEWNATFTLSTILPSIQNTEFCETFLDPEVKKYENSLSLSYCGAPSKEFLNALRLFSSNAKLGQDAKEMLSKFTLPEDELTITLTEKQCREVEEACRMLHVLNCYILREEIIFVDNLGAGVLGCVRDRRIYISRQCLSNGKDFLAITLYEEWVHLKMGYLDESRGMQQFLFDKILELIKR